MKQIEAIVILSGQLVSGEEYEIELIGPRRQRKKRPRNFLETLLPGKKRAGYVGSVFIEGKRRYSLRVWSDSLSEDETREKAIQLAHEIAGRSPEGERRTFTLWV